MNSRGLACGRHRTLTPQRGGCSPHLLGDHQRKALLAVWVARTPAPAPRPRPITHPALRLPPLAHLQTLLPTSGPPPTGHASQGGRGVPLVSEDSAVSVSRRCARCLSTIQKRTLEPPLTVLFGYYSFFSVFFFFAMHSISEQNVPSSSPRPWWGGDRGESISLRCVPLPAPISEVNWYPPGSAGAFSTAFYWSGGIF